MIWRKGIGFSRKYKTHYYWYNFPKDPDKDIFEVFIHRKWTGKKYINKWKVELVKNKHTIIKQKTVNSFPSALKLARSYMKRYLKR